LLPGSLITLRRRCARAACRCARGELHETPALSYSVAGRTKMLTLRAEDVDAVAEAVARYRVALRELETEARDELAALMACVAARRGTGRERGPPGGFAGSAELFTAIVRFPAGPQAGTLEHGELEERLAVDGRDLLRQLLQDHLDLRAAKETRVAEVVDADGIAG
jgi:hypothetical protein